MKKLHYLNYKWVAVCLACLWLITGTSCQPEPTEAVSATPKVSEPSTASATTDQDAFYYKTQLGKGVNLGNALEAPNEGEWGLTLQANYFSLIREAGFDTVRIPIRWSAHAASNAPYTIQPSFLDRVDWAIAQAELNNLNAIINIHHFNELMSNPKGEHERFLAIWQQLATHYQDYPDTLYFEILNEPHDQLTAKLWNTYLQDALNIIRATNPTRPVIVGPVNWNSHAYLHQLELPEDDRQLIVTFHYYSPFQFTHQGAEWADGSEAWLGTTWDETVGEQQAVIEDFKIATRWAEQHNRPLFLGEFGAYYKADDASRIRWMAFIRAEAEKQNMAWAYWEFGSGFGLYDPATATWRANLRDALIPAEATTTN